MTRTIISLIATLIIGTWTAMASRPLFKWFNVKQPDGTVVTVRKEGNGQFAYYVSTDGIALLRDAADNLTYATKSGKHSYLHASLPATVRNGLLKKAPK